MVVMFAWLAALLLKKLKPAFVYKFSSTRVCLNMNPAACTDFTGKLKMKKILILPLTLASFFALPQLAVQAADLARPMDKAQGSTRIQRQLETLLLCKSGTNFSIKSVASKFQAFGLVQDPKESSYFFPPKDGPKPMLFGNQVLLAEVRKAPGGQLVMVYLKGDSGINMAKNLGATEMNYVLDANIPYYYKETSKRTKLVVGGSDYSPHLIHDSNVMCRIEE